MFCGYSHKVVRKSKKMWRQVQNDANVSIDYEKFPTVTRNFKENFPRYCELGKFAENYF